MALVLVVSNIAPATAQSTATWEKTSKNSSAP